MIISLEVVDSAKRAAGRARFAPKMPVTGTRLSLSICCCTQPRDTAPTSLAEAVPLTLHSLKRRSIGGSASSGRRTARRPTARRSITPRRGTRLTEGLFHRALVNLRVKDPDRGLNLQWREASSAAGQIASRGLTVDLSHLKPGQYRVRLTLTSGADLPIIAERSIVVL